jgi:hypothetical protein
MKVTIFLSFIVPVTKGGLALLLVGALANDLHAAAAGIPISELLEKGIYSEETRGDLDAAMKFYQQVVDEAKGGEALAAQAQYRIGVCHYKKKNYAEATAAFEKLIKDFPEQKELVGRAREYLAGAARLLPAPWVDGEEMKLDIKFPSGFTVGTAIYMINSVENNGQKLWQVGTRTFAGIQSFSRVEVEADSFKPIHSRWKHVLIGDAEVDYGPAQAQVKLKGKDEVKKIELEGLIYDNEEAIQLMRRLPLAAGYKTTLRFLSSLAAGAIIPVKLEVIGQEKVTVPAGSFDCFKVELNIHQTFWYSADANHYLVKFEAGGALAELTAVTRSKAGEGVKYHEPEFGFSVTAPPGWNFYRSETPDEKDQSAVVILDPDAEANLVLKVQSQDTLKPEAKKSVRAWAELQLSKAAKEAKELQVRPDSWKERTVSGHAAVSVIADFVEGKEKKVAYGVFTFGATNAAVFHMDILADQFEGFRPRFEIVIDSYKSN